VGSPLPGGLRRQGLGLGIRHARVPELQDKCHVQCYGKLGRTLVLYADSVVLYPGGVGADYSPQEVADLLAADDQVQLIDVRQAYEHEAGRIAGDRLLELAELSGQADTIDRDRPVVFYCRSGSRSAMAAQAFSGAGYDAHNMSGGLLEWHAAGLPLEPADGHVADS
jgi:rhodanese-related sulfurtransferase